MSRLTELIAQAKQLDPSFGADLEAEVMPLAERVPFGLNFERHMPESTELPLHPVRKGAKVRILPPRGSTLKAEPWLWRVERTETVDGVKVAHLTSLRGVAGSRVEAVADLIVVAEFKDHIYPGLRSTEAIHSAGDQPWHMVINGENYHALETLLYTHQGKIDCIYIDPPYNTGNDDWLYNDRYVDGDDLFRHSKWLAFMERRLEIAYDLLKPSGFLLASIDDREHARLKLLLDDVFGPSHLAANFVWRTDGNLDNQAVIKTNHEYILMYAKNPASMFVTGVKDPNLPEESKLFNEEIRNSVVKNGPKNPQSGIVLEPGFPANFPEGSISARSNKFPNYVEDLIVRDYRLVNRVVATTGWANGRLLRQFISNGYQPVVDSKGQETIFELTHTGAIENVKRRREAQHHILTVLMNMGTVETAGNQLSAMGVAFPYPKPQPLMQYLASFTQDNGTILDFFGGSGSTLEAVMRLNARDGGSLQCILVTNNEVGNKEAHAMRKAGLRKGDLGWEAKGVHEHVARPRIKAVVTGECQDGSTYDDTVDANVEFFDLTYESPFRVRQNWAFKAVSPLLWAKAGARGRRVEELSDGWDVADVYGVLEDFDQSRDFLEAVEANESVTMVFVVTEDDAAWQMVCASLPERIEPVRLYSSYLENFEINTGRRA